MVKKIQRKKKKRTVATNNQLTKLPAQIVGTEDFCTVKDSA